MRKIKYFFIYNMKTGLLIIVNFPYEDTYMHFYTIYSIRLTSYSIMEQKMFPLDVNILHTALNLPYNVFDSSFALIILIISRRIKAVF